MDKRGLFFKVKKCVLPFLIIFFISFIIAETFNTNIPEPIEFNQNDNWYYLQYQNNYIGFDKNNGVIGFVEEKPNTKGKCLTIALNGSVGETFFQIEDFITSGDNAILNLKQEYNPYLLLYLGFLLKIHQWKYNYYRKLSINKLKSLKLPMPYKDNEIDLEYIKKIVTNCYGFDKIKEYL